MARWLMLVLIVSLLPLTLRAETLLPPASPLRIEQVHLDDVEVGRAEDPRVTLRVRVLGKNRQPAALSPPWPIEIRDDGRRIRPSSLEVEQLMETEEGVAYVLVLDVGGAMELSLPEIKEGASVFLRRAREHDHVSVVTFSDEARILARFEDGHATKLAEIRNLKIDSSSVHSRLYDGVHLALGEIRSRPALPRHAFVVVFSDGGDTGSLHGPDVLIGAAARREGHAAVPLHSLGYPGLLGDGGHELLRGLSGGTTGEFVPASSPFVVAAFADDVWNRVMRSYVVSFGSSMDGELHHLEVELAGIAHAADVHYPPGDGVGIKWILFGIGIVVVTGAFLARRRIGSGRAIGRLVSVDPSAPRRTILLSGPQIRIGAVGGNDVVIDSAAVSGRHAVIHVHGREVEIEDIGSLNGTFVNDEEIRTSPLRPGDRVRLADVELLYVS